MNVEDLKKSRLYSEELGIDLSKGEKEIFKWFIASILFGRRISEEIAKRTYRAFERYDILSPEKIIEAGWDELVRILDEGGYVRYDFSTATRLLEICNELLEKHGFLSKLHGSAEDEEDLEKKLLAFKGIGSITVNIFLRELRPFREKSNPDVLPMVEKHAKDLGIDLDRFNRKSMIFTRIEAGLIRLRRSKTRYGQSKILLEDRYLG